MLKYHPIFRPYGLNSKKINTSDFHSLEVVSRGSNTQLQVGETLILDKLAGKG